LGELVARYYDELRAIAASKRLRMNFRESSPTSIVAGSAVRILDQRTMPQGKEHFLAIATTIMSRYVLDELRKRRAAKRNGNAGEYRPRDDGSAAHVREDPESIMNALSTLSEIYPRQAEALSLHAVCDVPAQQIAQLLGVSVPTVERDLRFARAWLLGRAAQGGVT